MSHSGALSPKVDEKSRQKHIVSGRNRKRYSMKDAYWLKRKRGVIMSHNNDVAGNESWRMSHGNLIGSVPSLSF